MIKRARERRRSGDRGGRGRAGAQTLRTRRTARNDKTNKQTNEARPQKATTVTTHRRFPIKRARALELPRPLYPTTGTDPPKTRQGPRFSARAETKIMWRTFLASASARSRRIREAPLPEGPASGQETGGGSKDTTRGKMTTKRIKTKHPRQHKH